MNWWAASSCVGVVHRLTPASTFRTVLIACATLLESGTVEKCAGDQYDAVPRTPRVVARSKRAARIRKVRVTESALTTQDLLLPRVARGDQAAHRHHDFSVPGVGTHGCHCEEFLPSQVVVALSQESSCDQRLVSRGLHTQFRIQVRY